MNIILGSKSPRRQELLKLLDLDFTCRTCNADETYPDTLTGEQIPLYIARTKSRAFGTLPNDTLLITADTIVWMNGVVYGKPNDEAEARQFLKQLSGKTHEVITGVCLRTARSERSFAVCTQVQFASLTDDEINYYTSRYNPVDKAGAYGIQEWIGAVGVEHINGSYFNVMGLPVSRLWKEIKSIEADEASATASATPTT